ncbi:hypothetical protein [Hyphomonas sp.]|jgi:hypothetical protein|uniref:hypothetical protein n=1 Tax=Hyphomonas sp. TaxID=87 RepID=UPI0025B81E4D|nr:hypothetical protein [Hyphomonas sp.]
MTESTIGAEATAVRSERPQFFARSAIVMAAIVVLSFPLTYYLPVASGTRDFDTLYHLHALVFFAWIALYVLQTQLTARGQIARHREIGLAGFALTGVMIPLGYWIAQRAAVHRLAAGHENPYEFTWYNVIDITSFAVLMTASILLVTRHKEWHRRLTFTAAAYLTLDAATRWTLKVPGVDPFILDLASYAVIYPFLAALGWFDWRTLKHLHPATITCTLALIPLHLSSAWIARSDWWNNLAPGLIGPP